jgi:hypothetical protein
VRPGEAFRGIKVRPFPVIGTREKGTKVRVAFNVPIQGYWDGWGQVRKYRPISPLLHLQLTEKHTVQQADASWTMAA